MTFRWIGEAFEGSQKNSQSVSQIIHAKESQGSSKWERQPPGWEMSFCIFAKLILWYMFNDVMQFNTRHTWPIFVGFTAHRRIIACIPADRKDIDDHWFPYFIDWPLVSLLYWLTKTPHDCWQNPLPNTRYLHPPKTEGFAEVVLNGIENPSEVFETESHQRAQAQCGILSTSHEREERAHPRCAVNRRVAHVTAAAHAVSQRPRNGHRRIPRTANRREQEGAPTGQLGYNIRHFITMFSEV